MAQLQNIPSRSKDKQYDERIQKLGPAIRQAFRAPPPDDAFPEGYDIIGSDCSQLELRLGAYFTRDPTLMKVYGEKADVGAMTFYTGDIHNETKTRMGVSRKLAKNLNFGLFYGMSADSFARYAQIYLPGTKLYDVESADKFVVQFHSTYCGVFDYHESLRKRWWEGQRSFPTISGRFRHFPRTARVSPGTIYNSKIQGSAADVLKVHLWALSKYVFGRPEFVGLKPLIQVHDEFVFQCPKSTSHKAAVMVKFIMEHPWFDLGLPLLASTKICETWADKDVDAVPEVGVAYARVKTESGDREEDRTFKPSEWGEYLKLEEEDGKKKKDEEKRIVRKGAVAMLTPDQKAWARSFLPKVTPMFGKAANAMKFLDLAEFKAKKEAARAE